MPGRAPPAESLSCSPLLVGGILALFVAGCATPLLPDGGTASSSPPKDTIRTYGISLEYGEAALPPMTKSGLTISATVQPVSAELAFKYSLTSRVNGHYFLMPDPPRLYTIHKVPYYKSVPAEMSVVMDLNNNTHAALPPEEAIAAFMVNGRTISEETILLPGMLPSEHSIITLRGPSLATMEEYQGKGTLRIVIYGVHIKDANESFWWETEYSLTRSSNAPPVETVLRTPREEVAKQALKRLASGT